MTEYTEESREITRQIAQTIAEQLTRSSNPVGALKTMVGARNFAAIGMYASEDPPGLLFSFPKPPTSLYRSCEIRLMPTDTYQVTFCTDVGGRNKPGRPPRVFNDVYCDQLSDLFEDCVGMFLTILPRQD